MIEGYDAAQIELRPHGFIVGNALSRGNPLVEAILDARLPMTSGPQWLAEHVLAGKRVLAVAGTHGKTTTSAMLAWILEQAGQSPGFLIGGVPRNFGVSARASASPYFVIEADEYDTAFFDKRSKFVHYRAEVFVVNNLEFDHADIFTDLAAIKTQFHHALRIVPRHGKVIANGGYPAVRRVIERGCYSGLEWFNEPSGWRWDGAAGAYRVLRGEVPVADLRLDTPGAFTRDNAVAAIAAAHHVGVAPEAAAVALRSFLTPKRRLEQLGVQRGVSVYDDFAHHPTAIAATIAALREQVGAARILVVFEPRSNTMKLGPMKDALPVSLAAAARSFCYAAGLSWDAAAALAPLGEGARVFQELSALVQAVAAEARAGDHVLVMSNGGFGGVHQLILDALAGSPG
jgi:UDP-N-acetylmuramate: L-alanyl-gamma-D-glutamyl-meso-diaminopimelate ligase